MRKFSHRTWPAQAYISPQEAAVAFEYFRNNGHPINTISGLVDACVGFVAQLGISQGIEMPESQDDAKYILRQMGHNPNKRAFAVYEPKGQTFPVQPQSEADVQGMWKKVDTLQAKFMAEGMEEEDAFQQALKQFGGK